MLKIAKKYKFNVDFIAVNYRSKLPQTELRLSINFDYYSDFIPWRTVNGVELLRTNDFGHVELVVNKDLTALPDSELIKLFSELRSILEVK